MVTINRFTGDILYKIEKQQDHQNIINDIITDNDPEYFEVDEIIVPIIQKLIRRGIITHSSCSGHPNGKTLYGPYETLDDPYLVIDKWIINIIEIVDRRMKSDPQFYKNFVDYVQEISFITINQSKRVFDEYKSRNNKYSPRVISNVVGEDEEIKAYTVQATGVYFKDYYQYCNEHEIDYDCDDSFSYMQYVINLWRWVDSVIDMLIPDEK